MTEDRKKRMGQPPGRAMAFENEKLTSTFARFDLDGELRTALATWISRVEELEAQGVDSRDAGLQAANESANARLISLVVSLLAR